MGGAPEQAEDALTSPASWEILPSDSTIMTGPSQTESEHHPSSAAMSPKAKSQRVRATWRRAILKVVAEQHIKKESKDKYTEAS